MSRAAQLAKRRAMLVAECQIQRTMLRTQGQLLGGDTGWFKSGASLLGRIKNLPGWVSLLLTAAVVLIPGRAAKVARSALMLWQFWQSTKSAKPEAK